MYNVNRQNIEQGAGLWKVVCTAKCKQTIAWPDNWVMLRDLCADFKKLQICLAQTCLEKLKMEPGKRKQVVGMTRVEYSVTDFFSADEAWTSLKVMLM